MAARSCSSFVVMGSETKSGDIIYAKNSDRPFNEAQPLIYYPAKDHPEGSFTGCSFIKIPQVKHTYACIGSKPHFFWGFEHGINEFGLMIGNEQVSGREIPERRWGLIGMDLLRLALERARTAREAIEVIDGLLSTIGTGGAPGHRIAPFNSNFIISDPHESYMFESHQRKWVAKKVDRYGYLANCYSIQEDYDLIADGTIEEACEKGWWHPEASFNPAKAWTVDELMYDESEGFVRYSRLGHLLSEKVASGDKIDAKYAMGVLRDHYEDVPELNSIYSKAANKICTICSHPGGVGYGCASAASTVTIIRKDVPRELQFTYWGSMAPPCCSIFRPYYNIDFIPEDLQHAESLYRPEDQWWQFIELERYISLNYDKFAPKVKAEFSKMEDEFIQQAEYVETTYNGDIEKLRAFSAEASKRSSDKAVELTGEIKSKLMTKDIDRMLLKYFTESSAECGMEYDENIIK